ncbi:MAG: DUF1684 domain-containing protein [Bacteroidota bacterium]
MKKALLLITLCSLSLAVSAQSYNNMITEYRKNYRKAFVTDPESPLKPADTAFLRFYKIDKNYCVVATLQRTPNAKPFAIQTHSGKSKSFRQYGTLSFTLLHKPLKLQVYQNMMFINDPQYKDELFIPFTDDTNYKETYGGGRYIDISLNDIRDNKVILDFNKCYNPLCAFASGFSCPIPPKENSLKVAIRAGERSFGRPTKE